MERLAYVTADRILDLLTIIAPHVDNLAASQRDGANADDNDQR